METLPNLFVVGAAKSGTTAIHNYFKHHPDVFVPEGIKELNYMAYSSGLPDFKGPGDKDHAATKSITTLSAYKNCFQARNAQPISADVSPAYLYYPQASRKIAELCPTAKIVIILRNPVECVFSMFSMMRRDGREPCASFLEAFERTGERQAAGWEWAWDYKGCFLFSGQVRRYLELFPQNQLFIRRYEELNRSPEAFYRALASFLDLQPTEHESGSRRLNEGARRVDILSKNKGGRAVLKVARILGKALPQTVRAQLKKEILEKPAYRLTPEQRLFLVDHFRDDVQKLGAMLQWDLSDWLKL